MSSSSCTAAQLSVLSAVFANDTSGNIIKSICSSTAVQNAGIDLFNTTEATATAISAINAWQMDIAYGVDSGWLITCGAMVFIMHGGFAMVSL